MRRKKLPTTKAATKLTITGGTTRRSNTAAQAIVNSCLM